MSPRTPWRCLEKLFQYKYRSFNLEQLFWWSIKNCFIYIEQVVTEPHNTHTLVARWLVCTEGWLHRWQGWRWSTLLCLASMAMFSAACQSLTVCGHISLQEQLQAWLRAWLSVLWSLSNQREFLLNACKFAKSSSFVLQTF